MKQIKDSFRLMLFVSAIFLVGCIKNDGEAYEAPPDLASGNTKYVDSDSFDSPLFVETYRFDTLSTSGREYLFAGNTNDFFLGKLNTESYFQFLPESYPLKYPDSTILEEYTKATITLQTDRTYGVFGTFQFQLHELTESLNGDKSYFASDPSPAYKAEPMYTTANAARQDKFIRLDANELGRQIISKWKEWGSFTSDQQFLTQWKGLAIKAMDSESGQITRFDLQYKADVAPAFLQVFYREKTGSGSVLKSLKFRTNGNTVQFYKATPDYTGKPWSALPVSPPSKAEGIGLPTNQSDGLAAIQGLGGLAIKVKMPGLLEWKKKQTQKIKIFKAELEITPRDPGSLPAPEYLRISSRTDYAIPKEDDLGSTVFNDLKILSFLREGLITTREQAKRQTEAQIFSYSTTNNTYVCSITSHIQAIIDGTVTSDHFNLYSAQWNTTTNRILIAPQNIKLKIYYYPI